MNVWKPLYGRITLLVSAPSSATLTALELYRKVWERDPDNFQSAQTPIGPSSAQGRIASLTANCNFLPNRVDFTFSPDGGMSDPTLAQTLRTIASATELQRQLKFTVGRLENLSQSLHVNRVALNLQYVSVVDSIEEANNALKLVLGKKFQLPITDEEDFILQINHPEKSSRQPEFSLNVVTKWSVEKFQVLTFMGPGPGFSFNPNSGSMVAPVQKAFTASSVVFDINNVPTTSDLSSMVQRHLLVDALRRAEALREELGLHVEG